MNLLLSRRDLLASASVGVALGLVEAPVLAAPTAGQVDGVAIAHRLFDGIENRDAAAFDATCAPDAVIWQAHRPHQERPFVDVFRNLAKMHNIIKGLRYANRRYELLANGDALLRHMYTGTTVLGKTFEAYMMIRLTLVDGKITRIDQIVDTAQLQPVYEATQQAQKR